MRRPRRGIVAEHGIAFNEMPLARDARYRDLAFRTYRLQLLRWPDLLFLALVGAQRRQLYPRWLEISLAFYALHPSRFRLRKRRLGGRQNKGPQHHSVQEKERLPKTHTRKTVSPAL